METGTITVRYTAALISSVIVSNNDKIALYESSQISITVTTPFSLLSAFTGSLADIVITIPSGFTISGTSTCSSSVGICSVSSASQYSISGVGLSVINFAITLR